MSAAAEYIKSKKILLEKKIEISLDKDFVFKDIVKNECDK